MDKNLETNWEEVFCKQAEAVMEKARFAINRFPGLKGAPTQRDYNRLFKLVHGFGTSGEPGDEGYEIIFHSEGGMSYRMSGNRIGTVATTLKFWYSIMGTTRKELKLFDFERRDLIKVVTVILSQNGQAAWKKYRASLKKVDNR